MDSINAELTFGINKLSMNKSAPTKDVIKAIIKNEKDELLLFKNKLTDKYDLFTIKRLERRDIKGTLREALCKLFNKVDIREYHLTYDSTKIENFTKHIYIFELKIKINKNTKIIPPKICLWKEYKWVDPTKESKNKPKNNNKNNND